jgi:hypothetical protein
LPMLFGVVAAIGIGCGLLLLAFARPMRRLEEAPLVVPIDTATSPEPSR